MYSDDEAAALYDVLNPWGPSDDFYLDLVLRARSVIDLGCGTGQLLHRAREEGHSGRLCGVDPDRAMLEIARERADVEWVESKAAEIGFEHEFELALMTGHAFQALATDDDVRSSLDAIRRALIPGGHFAFETHNPLRRAWEDWDGAELESVDQRGRELLVWYEIQSVVGDLVTLTETTGTRGRKPLRVDSGNLRFLSVEALDGFLAESGWVVEERFGNWQREPFRADSDEIVTVARSVAPE
jgi:SAM-dependent methyltransferase